MAVANDRPSQSFPENLSSLHTAGIVSSTTKIGAWLWCSLSVGAVGIEGNCREINLRLEESFTLNCWLDWVRGGWGVAELSVGSAFDWGYASIVDATMTDRVSIWDPLKVLLPLLLLSDSMLEDCTRMGCLCDWFVCRTEDERECGCVENTWFFPFKFTWLLPWRMCTSLIYGPSYSLSNRCDYFDMRRRSDVSFVYCFRLRYSWVRIRVVSNGDMYLMSLLYCTRWLAFIFQKMSRWSEILCVQKKK